MQLQKSISHPPITSSSNPTFPEAEASQSAPSEANPSSQSFNMPAAKTSQSKAQFEKFVQLPTELRIQIWEYCTLGPRCIGVMFTNVPAWYQSSFRQFQPCPTLLHVNREAREVGLKSYKLNFSSIDGKPNYFSPSKDFLLLTCLWYGTKSILDGFPNCGTDFQNIQNLLFLIMNTPPLMPTTMVRHLQPFHSLETLVVRPFTGSSQFELGLRAWIQQQSANGNNGKPGKVIYKSVDEILDLETYPERLLDL